MYGLSRHHPRGEQRPSRAIYPVEDRDNTLIAPGEISIEASRSSVQVDPGPERRYADWMNTW